MSLYNEALRGLSFDPAQYAELPAVADANQDGRGHQVCLADMKVLNGDRFLGNSLAYLGTESHPCLASIDPNYQFDCLDLDRLITATLAREWTRSDASPRRGILVMGEKGVGKSTYIRQRLARQGIPCAVISWRPDMDAADVLYSKTLIGGDVVVEEGAMTLAAKGGYPVIVEEIDVARPAQLVALNEVIDTGLITIPETGEVIHARRGFMVFAACNSTFFEDSTGNYAGTRSQNASVLDRFFKFEMVAPDEAAEAAFVKAIDPGTPDEMAQGFGKFMALIRQASSTDGSGVDVKGAVKRLSLGFSRRNLIDWLDLIKLFGILETKHIQVHKYALGPVYTNGLPADERATAEHLLDVAFGLDVR